MIQERKGTTSPFCERSDHHATVAFASFSLVRASSFLREPLGAFGSHLRRFRWPTVELCPFL
jgi:hypothetical protein